MITGYTRNPSVLILIALLKEYGVKKVIISPGTTNLELSAGLQYEGSFTLISSVDERSAAYMACGMAGESGEPIAIACTEATASRNYFPGITEAYYRKLPIVVITGVHSYSQIGHLKPQIIDRSIAPVDTFICKVRLPVIKDAEDKWVTSLMINKALSALQKNGGGPVHIDLPWCGNDFDFTVKKLPDVRRINTYCIGEELPELPNGKIAVFLGAHKSFTDKETEEIDAFCASNNAVIFVDHTSGYKGKYAVFAAIASVQNKEYDFLMNIDLLIHMGEAMADEPTAERLKRAKEVWRVSPDGELRDTFGKLCCVFHMSELQFFRNYIKPHSTQNSYLQECQKTIAQIDKKFDDMPFSNVYIASMIAPQLPAGSTIHLGLSNSVRAWSVQEFPSSVMSGSNVGCRGIDGVLSTLIGASLINTQKLYFCVLGDLTFFYDMNALGNRSIGRNVRVIMVNNNGGNIFKQSAAPGHRFLGDEATSEFIAASGHFGNKSKSLVKQYVENVGFEYITASSKEEFEKKHKRFVIPELTDKPIFFEVFTEDEDERKAFDMLVNFDVSTCHKGKEIVKQILGEKGTKRLKKIIQR